MHSDQELLEQLRLEAEAEEMQDNTAKIRRNIEDMQAEKALQKRLTEVFDEDLDLEDDLALELDFELELDF